MKRADSPFGGGVGRTPKGGTGLVEAVCMNRFRREPESEFELRVDAIGGVLGLNVRGSLVAAGDQLHVCFEKAVRGGRPVVLDLSEATELGAAGVKTLMD